MLEGKNIYFVKTDSRSFTPVFIQNVKTDINRFLRLCML